MSILDIIGWYKSSSNAFTLRARVTQDGADFSKYTLDDTNGPWVPAAGDVFTDSADQADTVMSVEDATTFFGLTGAAGWTDGFAGVVRLPSSVRAHAVDFGGPVQAEDNPLTKATDVAVDSGLSVAHSFSSNIASFSPTGWSGASIVEMDPQSDLLELQSVHWHADQFVKTLINVSATNRFRVAHDLGVLPEESIFCTGDADIDVDPGGSVVLVRDTRTSADHWRAVLNSSGSSGTESGADTVSDDTVQTTDATVTTIATYTTLNDERAITLRALVWSREPTTDASAKWLVECEFNRDGSSVVTELDTNFLSQRKDNAAWVVTFVISGQDILVKVTGEAGKTVEWRCILEVSEHG